MGVHVGGPRVPLSELYKCAERYSNKRAPHPAVSTIIDIHTFQTESRLVAVDGRGTNRPTRRGHVGPAPCVCAPSLPVVSSLSTSCG